MAKVKLKDKIFKSKRKIDTSVTSSFGFVKTIDLYSRILIDYFTHGVADEPPENIEEGKFYYTTNRIYTKHGVKKMFFIHTLPNIVPRGFITELRDAIELAIYRYNDKNDMTEEVYLNFVIDGKHYKWDMSSRKTQGKWKHFTREYERVMEKAGNKTLQDELSSDKYTDQVRHKVNSFLYMKEATEEREGGSALYRTILALEVCATSNEALIEAEKTIQAFTFRNRIKLKDVFIQTNEYNKTFTPASHEPNSLLRQMQGGDIFTDDTLASFTLAVHGIVGDEVGIYHGVDIKSKNVVALDFSKGEDSKGVLLTASSGEGKSNYAKMLYTFITPLKQTYSVVVFDYEGTEYIPLGRVTGAKNISFTGGSGSYVNTMAIADLTGDDLIDSDLKNNAVEFTTQVFDLLIDGGMTLMEKSAFSEAFRLVYEDFEVYDDDPETWKNSKDCTFYHIFGKILQMKHVDKYILEYGEETLNTLASGLRLYFEAGNIYSNWFKNPITPQEIMDSQNIIYNFGMGGKDESSVTGKSLALRQMFAGYLTMTLASRNKVHGLRTIVFFEELQRYLQLENSGKILSTISSGGRKLGIIPYYITNTPSDIFALSDSFNPNIQDNIRALLANIKYQIIGALPQNEMLPLIKQWNLHNSKYYLDKLVSIRENSEANSPLKYCFYIRYKGQSTLVRMLSHPDLSDLPLYKTLNDSKSELKEDVEEYENQRRIRLNIGEDAYDKRFKEIEERDNELRNSGQDKWSKRMESDDVNSRLSWGLDEDTKEKNK